MKNTSAENIQRYQEQVRQLYKSFLDTINEFKSVVVVITIPYYIGQTNILEQNISDYGTKLDLYINTIPELYMREGQQIARKIITIVKK